MRGDGAVPSKGRGWVLEPCTVSESGQTSNCGGQLLALDLEEDEWEQFADGIAHLAAQRERKPTDFQVFKVGTASSSSPHSASLFLRVFVSFLFFFLISRVYFSLFPVFFFISTSSCFSAPCCFLSSCCFFPLPCHLPQYQVPPSSLLPILFLSHLMFITGSLIVCASSV